MSDETGEPKNVKIRSTNGVHKFTVQIPLESTVRKLKYVVAENCEFPADEQRLIYRGRILRDDRTLLSYGTTFASIITKCVTSKNVKLGMSVHAHLIKASLYSNLFVSNRLLELYSKCGSIRNAKKLLDDIPVSNTRSWNIMLSGFAKRGLIGDALDLFGKIPNRNIVSYNAMVNGLNSGGFYGDSVRMFRDFQRKCCGVVVDGYMFVSVASACGRLGLGKLVRQLHGVGVVVGLEFSCIVCNVLIDAYGKCGEIGSSSSVFNGMGERDVVSWTSMLAAFVKANRMDDALRIFTEMPFRNTVSWSALIAGFSQNGHGEKALDCFRKMFEEGVNPSAHTFVGVLSACANMALVQTGKQVHGYVVRCSGRLDCLNLFMFNALIDLYCKCGDMRSAKLLFDRMMVKDTISWNSLIVGFAQNGHAHESLLLFDKMMKENSVRPNHVTFLGVISACSHTGLVSKGLKMLEVMEKDYGISPRAEHYSAMVDLLGRNNRLKEAIELMEKAPHESLNGGMWGSILGACRVHGNLDLAERAADVLFEMEPGNAARYVMLSNIYAAAGRWEDARKLRKMMEERDLIKDVAYSWIEIRNERHSFVAKERNHRQIEAVYELIGILLDHMDDAWYVTCTNNMLLTYEDEALQ